MTMDLDRAPDGHWHFRLGPIERWVLGICGGLLVGLCWYVFNSFDKKLDAQVDAAKKQDESMQKLVVQQAVTNGQLATLITQVADMPGISTRVSKVEVEVEALKEGQKEWRQTRGAR